MSWNICRLLYKTHRKVYNFPFDVMLQCTMHATIVKEQWNLSKVDLCVVNTDLNVYVYLEHRYSGYSRYGVEESGVDYTYHLTKRPCTTHLVDRKICENCRFHFTFRSACARFQLLFYTIHQLHSLHPLYLQHVCSTSLFQSKIMHYYKVFSLC